MNTVISENPDQYEINNSEDILEKEEAIEELCRLKAQMDPTKDIETIQYYAPKIQKLQELIDELNKIPQGWENHVIKIEEDGNYTIFHKLVNYKKIDDIEYRIGIFVSEKKINY